MAWSATVMAWGVWEYVEAYKNSGQLVYALDGLKWVGDYLVKCHPDKDTYYVQVGDGNGDHGFWGK
jgi:endoglucanase